MQPRINREEPYEKQDYIAYIDSPLLDDLHRCLKKPPQKTLRLFHRYHKPYGKFIIDAGKIQMRQ